MLFRPAATLAALDPRPALRLLRRRPGFALLVILVLAVGMGATTAIFSVVDAVLIRPLPFPNADRLVAVWQTYPSWRNDPILSEFWEHIPLSYPEYQDWREAQTVFEDVALYAATPKTLMLPDRPLPLTLGVASSNFFRLLGVSPRLGRGLEGFEEGEAARIAVITHELWRDRFGADPRVLGDTIRLDQDLFQVVGVLPEGFSFRQRLLRGTANLASLWASAEAFPELIQDRGSRSFPAIGRLAAGVSLEQAHAESEQILRGERTPEQRGARVLPLLDEWTREARPALIALLAAVGLVLLVACGTAAGLMLGEGARRADEIAIRTALGASAKTLIHQFFRESIVLGLAGAALGLVLAQGALMLMSATLPADLPRAESIGIDGRIVAFALSLVALTALLFGVGPAVHFTRRSEHAVRAGRATLLPSQLSWQSLVVGGQIALCFLLIVGTALLGQSWLRLRAVDAGFQPSGVVAASLQLPTGLERSARVGLVERLVSRAQAEPGVLSVGGVSHLPLTQSTQSNSIVLEEMVGEDANPEAQRREVLPGYFETAGIPLLEGRRLDDRESQPEARTVLVNRTFANRFFGERAALGRRLQWDRQWWMIVGVVGDVRQQGLGQPAQATFYVAYAQNPRQDLTLLVRTREGFQDSLRAGMLDLIREVDSEIAVSRLTPLETLVFDSLSAERFRSLIAAAFALSALILAVIGVYGVGSRLVAARLREIGIRMAVGAARRQIVQLILVRSQLVALAGVAAGALLALALGRFLASFLYGVTPTDVATYVAAAAGLLLLTLAAMAIPARRAANVDPATTLREG